jgi:hypothetical protein
MFKMAFERVNELHVPNVKRQKISCYLEILWRHISAK